MTKIFDQNKADRLMDEGFEFIESCEYNKALKIADKLEKMRYTGAFEIKALAYGGMGKINRAITVLEKGTEKAPSVWRFWNLLGNYCSDSEKYDKAICAYKNGLKCENKDEPTIQYNYALVLSRINKNTASIKKIQTVLGSKEFKETSENIKLLTNAHFMELMNQKKNYAESIMHFKSLKYSSRIKNDCTSEWSLILYKTAYAYWKLDQYIEMKRCIKQSISYNKHNEDIQWLMRELNSAEDYTRSKYYQILVEGKWFEPFDGEKEDPGFFTSYDVVANDLDEALTFIKQFEPKKVHDSLRIDKNKTIKVKKQPKGVYSTTGYSFFPIEE